MPNFRNKNLNNRIYLSGSRGDGRQDRGVPVRVPLGGRVRLAGDVELHREGALHERRKERGNHIGGGQQWHLLTGDSLVYFSDFC